MKFLITGGASIENNLGDQAMIFTLVEYLIKKYKNADIVVLDECAFLNRENVGKYNFRILPDIPMKHKLKAVNRGLALIYSLFRKSSRFTKEIENKVVNEYRTCDCIFQLAGFSISSQMVFSNVLSRIWDNAVAQKFNKRIILLPQSVGPFDFKGIKKAIFSHYLKKYINYPEFILCREELGKKLLEDFGCRKARIEHDLVLARPNDLDPDIIYRTSQAKAPEFSINREKDVVIVPNFRFLKYKTETAVCNMFEKLISGILKTTGGKVYILVHELKDDLHISRLIYSKFTNDSSVVLIEKGLSCIDTETFFSKFALGVPCRWHAVVHMIRAGLPHVVIGWAEKYHETARLFDYEELIFDIRSPLVEKDIMKAADWVYNNRKEIAGKILKCENEIKRTFCMDRILD